MKKTYLIAVFVLLGLFAMAQDKIKVEEKNDGSHKALVVNIYEADKSDVEKAWRSEMKKLGGKVNGLFADDCKWSKISENTFDVYCRLGNGPDNSVEMTVAIDLGGAYLSSSKHGSSFKAMKGLVHDFAVSTTRDAFGDQLKEATSLLSDYEKEQKKLVKENEKLHELIDECKEKISQAEEDIKENEKNQAEKAKQIEAQTAVVEEVKGKLDAAK